MNTKVYNYYLITLNYNGRGSGHCIGFNSKFAAYFIATFVFFGLADVVTWDDWRLRFT